MADKNNKGTDFQEKNWRKAILLTGVTVLDVVRNLDKTAIQIAVITHQDGTLHGTVTDGDIRRGLLRGINMSDSIDSIIQRDPLVVPPDLGREMVLQLMQANKIHQLPIVDDQRRVLGLHIMDELISPERRPNVMVIMAGGEGTRLRPHTENCPKPLLPVGGKPMLEHIIEHARSEGLYHFVIATHYLGHMIEEYFGDGSHWEVKIEYLREETPLGTAGAISMLRPKPTLPFLVTNGDLLTDIHYSDLLDFHISHQSEATMAVRLHEWQNPFGVIDTQGVDIIGIDEKPIYRSHINAGIYVLEPNIFELLGDNVERCDMPELFEKLRHLGKRTVAFPMHEPWLDIGRPDDFKRATKP